MASKTEIANRALAKIGDTRVSNIETDGTKKALVINDMWDLVRDALLQSYPWNFALKRASILADGTAPAWKWSKRYAVPTDFLSLIEIQDFPDYEMVGGFIETDNSSPLKILYVSRVEAAGDFDPLFAEALASSLAVEIVEVLTQSNTKKNILLAELESNIKAAFAADAIQDMPQEQRPDSWLTSREDSYDDDINYNI